MCPGTGVDFFLCKKSLLHLTRFEPRTVQPVASRCTDLFTTVCPLLDACTLRHRPAFTQSVNNTGIERKGARPCNHFCSAKSISFTYSEYVFVALVSQHAMCMQRNVICGLSSSTLLVRIIPSTAVFSKKTYRT